MRVSVFEESLRFPVDFNRQPMLLLSLSLGCWQPQSIRFTIENKDIFQPNLLYVQVTPINRFTIIQLENVHNKFKRLYQKYSNILYLRAESRNTDKRQLMC